MGPVPAAVLRLSLWGSLLAGLLLALRPLLRGRVSGAVRYYLWLAVLLRLCIPAGITLPLPVRTEAPPVSITAPAPLPVPKTELPAPYEPQAPAQAQGPAPGGAGGPPPAPSGRAARVRSGLWAARWAAGAAV